MDGLRCWIVIPWAQYAAPHIPERGVGKATGPLCMGHLIPDIKHLDKIMNRQNGPPSYPVDMPAMTIRSLDMQYQSSNKSLGGAGIQSSAPIAQVAGVTANANAAVAFQHVAHSSWHHDSVDFLTIMPTREYIADCIASNSEDSVPLGTGLGSGWTIYMISGLVIAHGGLVGHDREDTGTFGVGLGAGASNLAEFGFNVNRENDARSSTSRRTTTSHIFAVRLTTIFKKRYKKDWDYETLFFTDSSIGGVFTVDNYTDLRRQIRHIIPTISGLENAKSIGLEEDVDTDDDDIFIIPAEMQD